MKRGVSQCLHIVAAMSFRLRNKENVYIRRTYSGLGDSHQCSGREPLNDDDMEDVNSDMVIFLERDDRCDWLRLSASDGISECNRRTVDSKTLAPTGAQGVSQ